MNIEAGCACGATVKIEMSEEYINPRGAPDDQGRVFVAETVLDRWREEHKACAVAARYATVTPAPAPAPEKEPDPVKEYPEAAFAARVKKMLEFHTEISPDGGAEVALWGTTHEDNITWGELREFVKRAGL